MIGKSFLKNWQKTCAKKTYEKRMRVSTSPWDFHANTQTKRKQAKNVFVCSTRVVNTRKHHMRVHFLPNLF